MGSTCLAILAIFFSFTTEGLACDGNCPKLEFAPAVPAVGYSVGNTNVVHTAHGEVTVETPDGALVLGTDCASQTHREGLFGQRIVTNVSCINGPDATIVNRNFLGRTDVILR